MGGDDVERVKGKWVAGRAQVFIFQAGDPRDDARHEQLVQDAGLLL